jgi:hypothetical protein
MLRYLPKFLLKASPGAVQTLGSVVFVVLENTLRRVNPIQRSTVKPIPRTHTFWLLQNPKIDLS